MNKEYKEKILKSLKNVQIGIPENWEVVAKIPVGGLIAVGFSREKNNHLLVVSHQGRGVIDCNVGLKVSRDKQEYGDWHREQELLCQGIGVLKNEIISMSGFFGGGLPTINYLGEELLLAASDFPIIDIIFQPENKYIYEEKDSKFCYKIESYDDIRTFGFSYSGDIMIVALNYQISIYKASKFPAHPS